MLSKDSNILLFSKRARAREGNYCAEPSFWGKMSCFSYGVRIVRIVRNCLDCL